MARHVPNPEPPHPEPWRDDLSPDFLGGRNVGLQGANPAEDARTAYDVKAVHRRFHQFTDDELKRIPIVPAGARLEQGATYVDLRALDEGEFTATAHTVAAPDHWFVPKSEVDYDLWNRLISTGD